MPLPYCNTMPSTDSTALSTAPVGDPGSGGGATVELPAFSQIYQTYFNFVWASARRLGVGASEIDDVVQEIFIVIHGRLSTLENPESLRSWIYGIVRRTVSTFHRAKRAKVVANTHLNLGEELTVSLAPSPQELAEQSDQVRLLWSLLEGLDPAKREVFVLAELDEMTVPEIASALEIPLNTAYSRLRVARQELEAALSRLNARHSSGGKACPT